MDADILCFVNDGNVFGDVCTNECPERHRCNKIRMPLLLETLSFECSSIFSDSSDSSNEEYPIPALIKSISYNSYINGVFKE